MLISALLATAAAAQTPSATGPSIVVTAQRIAEQKATLAACLARTCPPDEDINATLALAESQLIDGNYRDARETLLASLGRNKREAARYPIPVADLYRANGRVAADLGLDTDYYRSTWGIYRTLKQGLPDDKVRHFSAMMEVAEMTFRTRGHERARLYYDMIASDARKAGRPDIAALAELRSAIRHLPPGSVWQVEVIRRIAANDSADMRAPALEAKLALARLAISKGDENEAGAIQKELANLKLGRPILIYSPPYSVAQDGLRGVNFESSTLNNRPVAVPGEFPVPVPAHDLRGPPSSATYRTAPMVEDMWLDVAFRVTPEGKVADLKVVRSKGDMSWAKPLLRSIEGRRYTPGDPASPASNRLERYTLTSTLETRSDTFARRHSPDTRVEYMDLSDEGGGGLRVAN